MSKLLSIIVPIYNVEIYLEECLNSILNQFDKRVEIVLVDDGSKDKSGIIADSFVNENINVIHKTNGGLSSARNAGLNMASGEYIAFLDSDDRLSNGCIKIILDKIEKKQLGDMCFMQCSKFYSNDQFEDMNDGLSSDKFKGLDRFGIIKLLARQSKFTGSSCTKIYKKTFLTENNLHFPLDRRLSEDLGFVRDCIYYANTYSCLDCNYYEYRQERIGSITSEFTNKTFEGLQLFIDESINMFCLNKKATNRINKFLMSFVAYEYSVLLYDSSKSIYEKSRFSYLKKQKWVLKYSKNKKIKMIYFLTKLLGIRITGKIICLIKH